MDSSTGSTFFGITASEGSGLSWFSIESSSTCPYSASGKLSARKAFCSSLPTMEICYWKDGKVAPFTLLASYFSSPQYTSLEESHLDSGVHDKIYRQECLT